MTLMSSISKLTTWVDQLAGEANVTKAQLDAKVALADAAVVTTQAEQAATEAARDEAAARAADATTHLATVKAGVTYQGISAIFADKAVTAVDVFLYDTSLDSDGGAWRKRCQHTSWYNEPLNTATRGARREFPAVAVVVAEADKVTIYDGDDPALPRWMVFIENIRNFIPRYGGDSGVGAVAVLNGVLSIGKNGFDGLSIIDFISDSAKTIGNTRDLYWNRPISLRNANSITETVVNGGSIVNEAVNDVAMTVLPDAPFDPATGLPVPTIAVATAGGLSVIGNNGAVQSVAPISYSNHNYVKNVLIADKEVFVTAWSSGQQHTVAVYDIKTLSFKREYQTYAPLGKIVTPFEFVYGITINKLAYTSSALVLGSNTNPFATASPDKGVGLIAEDKSDRAKGMSAILSSTYNTGWMIGDIRGAFLSDTDDTDLFAADEKVVNGTFDTDKSGWTPNNLGLLSVDDQRLKVETGNSGSWNYGYQQVPVVPGQAYRFRASSVEGTAKKHRIVLGTGVTNGDIVMAGGPVGTAGDKSVDVVFTATTTSVYVALQNTDGVLGSYTFFDDISLVPAAADRSVNHNGLIVNGTITRNPVADGAELVGYGGFDYAATKYLAQPYNSELAFGTGDFCLMWWNMAVNTTSQNRWLLGLYDPVGGEKRLAAYMVSPGGLRLRLNNLEYLVVNNTAIPAANTWNLFAYTRKDGVVSLYRDGQLLATQSAPVDIGTATTDEFRVGGLGALGPDMSKFALVRISATAPTAEQIGKIYEDERKLFQPGAQCTLYGTSDAVTALAHDHKTNLLHVGTSAGRSVFDGLQRLAHTETPVTTAISAASGLIVEE